MDVYSELFDSLGKCVAACNNCASSCLDEENVQSMTGCIKLDLDCADTCHLTLKLLARDSSQLKTAVALCRDVCAECANECESHQHEHCNLCAEACRDCEECCKKYLIQSTETAFAN